jgi:hypothetical protein
MKTLSINRITLAAFAVLFAVVLYSCKKESSSNTSAVTEADAATYSDESAQTEASFDDVEDVSMTAASEEGVASSGFASGTVVTGRGSDGFTEGHYLPNFDELRLRIGQCATITVTPNDSTYPKTVTIDFGTTGCLCPDGKFRKGAIVLSFTGPIRHTGSVLTITLNNFYLNLKHIEGTKIITNQGQNSNIIYTTQVIGGKVTFPNGRGYQYEGLKHVTQVEGGSTPMVGDDVYHIDGSSTTQFNNGVTINLSTDSTLIKKVSCPWISAGVLKIKINDRVLSLNYGAPNNGDCDNKALLTWNNGNSSRLITLP